ncbi:MAG TPA: peptidylprolyl isomerase [Polyangiaceae bacterium]|jgi:peptidyl-prolyl cis-trans isomerase D
MLNAFRQRGLTNIIYGAVIVATILAFVITFRPQAQQKTASLSESCAARVRGRCIDPTEFGAAYRMLLPSRSQAASRKTNMKKVALDGLVERELLVDEAKRLGIGITDKELTDQLFDGYVRVSIPAADPALAQQLFYQLYQSYGVTQDKAIPHFNSRDGAIPIDFRDPKTKIFDMKVYDRMVKNMSNLSTTEFREVQARELIAAKMRDAVRDPIRISENEAWEEYSRRYSTATLTYIPVKESWASRWTTDVTQADIDAFLKDHKAALDQALEQRKKDDLPQAGHIRHILVKLPYGATDDEKAAGLAKLSWAAARIRAGEPFAEVARNVSDDQGSAAKGGDVGDKTDGFVAPFKAAADALKPGEITPGAVETQFGYHYLEKDDPAKSADVQAKLEKFLARDLVVKSKAAENAQFVAKRLDDALRAGKPAEDAIKDVVAQYVHPQKLDVLRVLPGPPAAADAGASDGGATIAKQPTATAPFDASTDPDKPATQTSNAFNRGGDPFPGISPDGTGALMQFAFTGKDGDVMDAPLRTPTGFNVVILKQHKQATHEELEKDRDTFEQELLRAKRDEALSLYVKRLREQAKDEVKVDDNYIQEAKVDGGSATEDEDEY